MNTEQIIPSPPPLVLALWSLRHRMETTPTETLRTIYNDLKISLVELAGFFDWTAPKLKKELDLYHLKVHGFHGPNLTAQQTSAFYSAWASRHFDLLHSDKVIFETTPDLFQEDQRSDWNNIYDAIAKRLIEIARSVGPGRRVSYHCFPHDFFLTEGRLLVSRIFDQPDLPGNLGLQLDTFWLHESKIDINKLLSLPIHSVHLNERDEVGRCCQLGTYPEKCSHYAKALIKTQRPIDWVLENDPCDDIAVTDNPPHLYTICKCVEAWPSFWASLFQNPEPKLDKTMVIPFELPLPAVNPHPVPHTPMVQSSKALPRVYSTEFSTALTGFLFGQEKVLKCLKVDDPRVRYYVTRRTDKTQEGEFQSLRSEQELFTKYWPPSRSPQVIQVVGNAGSGKSTFIRYFFQYYLPHREELLAQQAKSGSISAMAGSFAVSFHRHIILYVDLRRPDPSVTLRECLFKRLSDNLLATAQNLNLTNLLQGRCTKNHEETWLIRNILRLAKEKMDTTRKYYISWVLDNADQLGEFAQGELVNIIHDYIPEEPVPQSASDPVTDQDRALWRIIMPIRPETQINLARFWNPFHNSDSVFLGALDPDTLIETRANWVQELVNEHQRPLHENINYAGSKRSYFKLKASEEMAELFRNMMLAASRLRSESQTISNEARGILDQLVHGSSRRRLTLVPRVAFSRSFHERYEQGLQERWHLPVIDFYFFDGLICGEASEFIPTTDDCMLLNLYDLGEKPGAPHSICVGLHATYLLASGKPWGNVRATLRKLGYNEGNLSKCEQWLEAAETIKRLHNGAYQVEVPILKGHWALLKERAYTDNMAVACARSWNRVDRAPRTDPLDPYHVVRRFKASLWFMQEIWKAECSVATFNKANADRAESFTSFAAYFEKQRLPSITSCIAAEYQTRILALRKYPKVDMAIKAEEEQWISCREELQTLVRESGVHRIMKARK